MTSNFKLLLIFFNIWNFLLLVELLSCWTSKKIDILVFWGHFVKNREVYTGETNILVNVMALGLECQANTQKYCFRKKGKKITNLIECDFCHMELCGEISAIAGKIKFSFLWLHSELIDIPWNIPPVMWGFWGSWATAGRTVIPTAHGSSFSLLSSQFFDI